MLIMAAAVVNNMPKLVVVNGTLVVVVVNEWGSMANQWLMMVGNG